MGGLSLKGSAFFFPREGRSRVKIESNVLHERKGCKTQVRRRGKMRNPEAGAIFASIFRESKNLEKSTSWL